jgi:hypothetical protein
MGPGSAVGVRRKFIGKHQGFHRQSHSIVVIKSLPASTLKENSHEVTRNPTNCQRQNKMIPLRKRLKVEATKKYG